MNNFSKYSKKLIKFFGTKEMFLAYLIIFFVFAGTSLVFLLNNNLLSWDHWAHVDSAEFILKNTWPSPFGWNPNYFNGYPQNTFYPPLASWAVATIGIPINFIYTTISNLLNLEMDKLVPISIAYKIFLITLYFLSIFLIYNFSKTFWKKKNALKLSLILIITMFIPDWIYYGIPVGIGGTISSTFEIGLISAYVGFLAIIYFITQYEKKESRYYKLGIIFAIGLLSHYVFLIVALYMLINFIINKNIKKPIITLIIGLGLTSFWWIPFIVYNDFVVSANYVIPLLNLTTITMIIGIILLIIGKGRLIEKKLFVFSIILFLFVMLFEKTLIQGQLFRVFFIIVFLSTPLIFSYLKEIKLSKIVKNKKLLHIQKTAPILLALIVLFLSLQLDFSTTTKLDFTTEIEPTNNLHIVLGPTSKIETHHALFYEYVNQTGNRISRGLFSEQSPNIVLKSGLHLHINPDEFIWGTTAIRGDFIKSENFKPLLYLFGVQSVISTEFVDYDNTNFLKARFLGHQYIKTNSDNLLWFEINREYEELDIIEYYFFEPQMAEILNYDPLYKLEPSDLDWLQYSAMFLSHTAATLTKHPVTGYQLNPDAKITNYQRTNNNIQIQVDSNTPVPILIKESYFPRWKAYVNGEETQIYLTAPYLMTIVGNGEIELKYGMTFIDKLSYLISGLSLILVFLLFIKKRV